jgi:hypothetical protein
MEKKVQSSTVPGISVADVRRGLSEVRQLLNDQNEVSPFDMTRTLSNGMPVWKFVHCVALGMHKKRSRKRKRVENEDGLDDNE